MTDQLPALARSVHLAGLAAATGALGFLVLVLGPAARRRGAGTTLLATLERTLAWLTAAGVATAALSGVLWLWLHAGIVAGGGVAGIRETVDVVTGTAIGRAWQVRLALLVLVGGLLVAERCARRPPDAALVRTGMLALSAAAAAGLAWTGHPVALEGPERILALGADAAHATAASLWLGGLLALAIALRTGGPDADPAARGLIAAVIQRFSTLALAAVAVVVVTGGASAAVLVGAVPRLVGTGYGRLLLLKIAVSALLVALGAVNRWILLPRAGDAARPLALSVAAEVGLGAVVLLLVGGLGATPPGRHVDPAWPFSFRFSLEAAAAAPITPVWVAGGALFAGAGLAAAVWALGQRRRPRWALALGLAACGYGTGVALAALSVDAYPTTYVRPAVPYHALSVARGAGLYDAHCASCHGVRGRGDGPAALAIDRPPADLTARHAADHTAGDFFWWISHGIGGTPMPGFRDRLDETDRWDVINFVRLLGAAERARGLTPGADDEPWLVAPDFDFGHGFGPADTLRRHRGWSVVHLVLFALPGSLERLRVLDRAWFDIGAAGARVLVVPMGDVAGVSGSLGLEAPNLPIVVEGAEEIAAAYLPLAGGAPSGAGAPSHVEYLVDRQGYVRARWRPGEPAWGEVATLVTEVQRLDREAPRAPAPDDHVH
jgi:putative copper resistance protein D